MERICFLPSCFQYWLLLFQEVFDHQFFVRGDFIHVSFVNCT
ncbi:hypothetical protein PHAVU_003G279701 [Phaseolus vulgaris]